MEHSFWFHKSNKHCKSCKKKNVKEHSVLFKECFVLFKERSVLISINIYIFIYIYIYWKKNWTFSRSFAKEKNVLAFFSVLRKGMLLSLHSLEKNGKECNVLLGLISRQKLEKRTEQNGTFLLKNGKEQNVPNGKECGAQPWF